MKLTQEMKTQCLALGLSEEGFNKLAHYNIDMHFDALLEKMQRVKAVYPNDCNNPLVWLCMAGDLEAIYAYLRANQLTPQYNDSYSRTIAHYLAWSGEYHAFKQFCEDHLIALDAKDCYERSLIHYLAWSGNYLAVADYLEENPEQLTAQDKLKRTITHYFAWSGNQFALRALLINHPERAQDTNSKGETFGPFLKLSGVTTSEQVLVKAARVIAIPLLKARVVGRLKYHEHAFATLQQLAHEGNAEATEALENAKALVECKRIRTLVLQNKTTDGDIVQLNQLVLDNVPGALQIMDQYWWGRSLEIKNNIPELEKLTQNTPFAHLRIAEYYLNQSKSAPGLTQYGYGLGLFYKPTNPKGDLLQKSKLALESSSKHSVMGVHHVMGEWYLAAENTIEACRSFGKSLLESGFYLQDSLLALQNLLNDEKSSEQVRCLTHLMLWRPNQRFEHLNCAYKMSPNHFIQYASELTEWSPHERLLLLSYAMSVDKTEKVMQATLEYLHAYTAVTDVQAVEFAAQSAKYFANALQIDEFITFALHVVMDNTQPLFYRAALNRQLWQQNLKREHRAILQSEWWLYAAEVRSTIEGYTLKATHDAPNANQIDIEEPSISQPAPVIETQSAPPAAPITHANDDEDDFNSRWDCK